MSGVNDIEQSTGHSAAAPAGCRESTGKVGYKRPPKHHQFKKGCSGNPKGRPRGRKSLPNALQEILDETVPVTVEGRPTRMSLKEALVSSAVKRALKGDKGAMDFVLFLAEKTGRLDDSSQITEAGLIILPERAATYEEWEAEHGAAARGDKYFRGNGQLRPPPRVSNVAAGDKLFDDGNLTEAFGTYRRALLLRKRPLENCETQQERERLLEVVERMMLVGRTLLLSGRYQEAHDVAVIAESVVPQEPGAYSLRLFALMFLNRDDDAKRLFEQFRGQMWTYIESEDGSHTLTWEAGIMMSFDELRNAGLSHPLMSEIEVSYARQVEAESNTGNTAKRRRSGVKTARKRKESL
jgi:hypothetical protein